MYRQQRERSDVRHFRMRQRAMVGSSRRVHLSHSDDGAASQPAHRHLPVSAISLPIICFSSKHILLQFQQPV